MVTNAIRNAEPVAGVLSATAESNQEIAYYRRGARDDSSTAQSLRNRYPVRLTSVPDGAGFHVLAALIAVVTGVIAMLSAKRAGRHPRFGTLYYWCLSFVFLTATILAAMRWSEDAHLFFLGATSFSAAILGRAARRRRWQGWVRIHISGMGLSYTLMLIAFYMDNGKQLPVWKHLPSVTYWLLPTAVGVPLIVRALLRYRRIGAET